MRFLPRLQQGDQFGFEPGDNTGDDDTGFVYEPPPDDSFFNSNDWQNWLAQQLGEDVINAGISAGEDPTGMAGLFQLNFDDFMNQLEDQLFGRSWADAAGVDYETHKNWYLSSSEGWNKIMEFGRTFYSGLNSDLSAFMGQPRITGGGGGGGSRAMTPEEIRNQFDIDQLSNQANNIKRSFTLEAFKDPRGIARAYVDAVVAGKGEKKIDFDTFVEERVKETGRFKAIFRNLPPGMDPRQYIAPLYQLAAQTDPGQAEDRAIGAAQFGASAAQFQERLNKTDAVTGSAPFISKMQSRLSQMKGVLRG